MGFGEGSGMRARGFRYGGLTAICHLLIAALVTLMPFEAPAAPARPISSAAPARTILAFGDSLTAGYQLRPAESFPAQLEVALRKEGRAVVVHNAGVSGDTTAQGRARLNWVLTGMKVKPDLAILELGANDMLRGQSPAAARANLDAMLAEFRKHRIPVILAGMLATPNLGATFGREFNGIYPALAKQHGVPLYPFFMKNVVGIKGLQIGDGIHPSPAGVAVIVRGILPTVRTSLDRLH